MNNQRTMNTELNCENFGSKNSLSGFISIILSQEIKKQLFGTHSDNLFLQPLI